MIKNLIKPSMFLAAFAVALSVFSVNVAAQNTSTSGYLVDTRGHVVKDAFNLCWRTGYWTPALAIAECDPDLVPKEAAPKPMPAPMQMEKPKPMPKPAPKPMVRPTVQKVTLSTDALFDFDKSVIKPDARMKLDDLVGKIKDVNLEVVIAIGHTDRIGSDAYNMKLSLRRANAVKSYLINKGIPANRIYAEGKGKRQPVKDCPRFMETKRLIACLAPNRRVEVEVVGTRAKR